MDIDAQLALAVRGNLQGNVRGLSWENWLGNCHEEKFSCGMSRGKCWGPVETRAIERGCKNPVFVFLKQKPYKSKF